MDWGLGPQDNTDLVPFLSRPLSQVPAGCTRGLCSLLRSVAIDRRQRGLLTTSPAPAAFARPHQPSVEPQSCRASFCFPWAPCHTASLSSDPPSRTPAAPEHLPSPWLRGSADMCHRALMHVAPHSLTLAGSRIKAWTGGTHPVDRLMGSPRGSLGILADWCWTCPGYQEPPAHVFDPHSHPLSPELLPSCPFQRCRNCLGTLPAIRSRASSVRPQSGHWE